VLGEVPIKGNGWESVEGGVQYSAYTLPGGKNNREILLRLPPSTISPAERAELDRINAIDRRLTEEEASRRAAIEQKMTDLKRAKYKSSHWNEPNVLAHIRVNDRTDADGKRVLFVEEIQSDWGQDGKKKGFASNRAKPLTLDEHKRALSLQRRDNDGETLTETERSELAALQNQHYRSLKGTAVPDAPFVTKTESWLNLALKRVVMGEDEGTLVHL
jgi:hypothetical protein